jgi:glycosyltransferase involved in cell wall biosynthesis
MSVKKVAPGHRLRVAVLGDFDGPHTQSWVGYFIERGHDVHGISYYAPSSRLSGLVVHELKSANGGGGKQPGAAVRAGRRLPVNVQRLVNLLRYRRAGLAGTVSEIAPDVLHAHYLVEHGLYGTSANFHPYVVSAWGSDVLVEVARSSFSRALARFTAKRADQTTANNRYMAREMVLKLGVERAYVQHIVLGVSRAFLDGAAPSVNLGPPDGALTVLSTRSLDKPLYNTDTILRAMALVREHVPSARLIVAGEGRLQPQLEGLARELGLGDSVTFVGQLPEEALRDAMSNAHVYVSVPSSDGTSVAVLQAMGAGCFPIVSDLPSQQELVSDDEQGLRVRPRDVEALGAAITTALESPDRRRPAVERNRAFVEDYGVLETNLSRMEAWYYRLAGRTVEYEP